MQNSMPVLACTDPNTDVGKIITDGGFGWWCESNDVKKFKLLIDDILKSDIRDKGIKARDFLVNHYSVSESYDVISKFINR